MAPLRSCARPAAGCRVAVPRHDGAADPARGDCAGGSRLLALRKLRCAARRERHAVRELRTAAQQVGAERLSVGGRAADRALRGAIPLGAASTEVVRGVAGPGGDDLARGSSSARAHRRTDGTGGEASAAAARASALIAQPHVYTGHAAVALALSRREQRLPIALLALAAFGPDWL